MSGYQDITQSLIIFTFGLPRILAVFILLPAFSKQVLPGLARNGVAASLTVFLYPIIAAGSPMEALTFSSTVSVVLKEILIGLFIGYGAAAMFWAIESVGFFIDNQRGSTMASSVDPLTGSQTSPMGILLTQALMAIFFIGGGFIALLAVLYESYVLWPVFSFFPTINMEGAVYFLSLLDKIVAFAVLLAAPTIIAMFMSECSLGLVSRFAPQLNVFFLAMPIKSAVGILILVLYISLLLGFFSDELRKIALHFSMLGTLFK